MAKNRLKKFFDEAPDTFKGMNNYDHTYSDWEEGHEVNEMVAVRKALEELYQNVENLFKNQERIQEWFKMTMGTMHSMNEDAQALAACIESNNHNIFQLAAFVGMEAEVPEEDDEEE